MKLLELVVCVTAIVVIPEQCVATPSPIVLSKCNTLFEQSLFVKLLSYNYCGYFHRSTILDLGIFW